MEEQEAIVTRRHGIVLAAAIAVILTVWAVVCASDTGDSSDVRTRFVAADRSELLRGLQGLHVIVTELPPRAEQLGLTRSALQTDTELQLRQYGIRVLTRDECLNVPGGPLLCVEVIVVGFDTDLPLLAFNVDVTLREDVLLCRDLSRKCLNAATWSRGYIGRVGPAQLASIRSTVKDVIAVFINDYLAANPKESAMKDAEDTATKGGKRRFSTEELDAMEADAMKAFDQKE